ncbi:hypothetical protein BDY21DRAFT_365873 [Lineolata rhizophorae]|uniref:Uncharacterized protein n=1 Tax=Lineolata rhizophorae TaxID=578093 RepID=A0A6A6NTU1_9PEZI|nr:hypothetical protein BDY21DRAFT_365873 [Lineolata rhizophorae]
MSCWREAAWLSREAPLGAAAAYTGLRHTAARHGATAASQQARPQQQQQQQQSRGRPRQQHHPPAISTRPRRQPGYLPSPGTRTDLRVPGQVLAELACARAGKGALVPVAVVAYIGRCHNARSPLTPPPAAGRFASHEEAGQSLADEIARMQWDRKGGAFSVGSDRKSGCELSQLAADRRPLGESDDASERASYLALRPRSLLQHPTPPEPPHDARPGPSLGPWRRRS